MLHEEVISFLLMGLLILSACSNGHLGEKNQKVIITIRRKIIKRLKRRKDIY